MICSGGGEIEIRDSTFLGKQDHSGVSHSVGRGCRGWWESLGTHLRPQNKPENKHGASSTRGSWDGSENRPQTPAISEQTAELNIPAVGEGGASS